MALSQLLAQVRDENGRITIPGFYDGVAPLSKLRARSNPPVYPSRTRRLKKLIGVKKLFGERGFTPTRTAQRAAHV